MNKQPKLNLFWSSVICVVTAIAVEALFFRLIDFDTPSWQQPRVSVWHWFILPGVVLGVLFLFELVRGKQLRYDNTTDVNNRIVAFFTHIFVPVCKHMHTLEHAFVTGVYTGEFGETISADWENTLRRFYSVVISHNIANKNLVQPYLISPWSQELETTIKEQYPEWETKVFYWKDIPNIENLVKECNFDKKHELFSQKMFYSGGKYNEPFNFSILNEVVFDKINVLCWGLFADKQQIDIKNPKDFEKKVANDLKQLGFSTYTTKATGDQGVDVLATKNDINFAIQCKLYSHPVGNKAVQEVCAGRDFYRCDYAVVVTNASFTKSARQCAKATDVILLNDNQLAELLKYTE